MRTASAKIIVLTNQSTIKSQSFGTLAVPVLYENYERFSHNHRFDVYVGMRNLWNSWTASAIIRLLGSLARQSAHDNMKTASAIIILKENYLVADL